VEILTQLGGRVHRDPTQAPLGHVAQAHSTPRSARILASRSGRLDTSWAKIGGSSHRIADAKVRAVVSELFSMDISVGDEALRTMAVCAGILVLLRLDRVPAGRPFGHAQRKLLINFRIHHNPSFQGRTGIQRGVMVNSEVDQGPEMAAVRRFRYRCSGRL
jgi:hypothetical protein